MSCTCKYGSGISCGFCQTRENTNKRLTKLEKAIESNDSAYARGVADGKQSERKQIVIRLRKLASKQTQWAAAHMLYFEADRIERNEELKDDCDAS